MANYATETSYLTRLGVSYDSATGSRSEVRQYGVYFSDQLITAKTSVSSPRVNGKLQLRPNAFNGSKQVIRQSPWSASQHTISGTTSSDAFYQGVGTIWYTPGNNLFPEQEAIDSAVSKWYNEVAANKTNLLEMYATRQQTANLISGTLSRLAGAAMAMKRGNLREAARHLGVNYKSFRHPTFSEQWLAWQYGWKPLLSDIYGAMESSDSPLSKVVTVNKKLKRPFERTSSIYGGPVVTSVKGDLISSATVSGRVTASNTVLKSASEYGITNPALLAWELLPYSFVVDWVLPVGTYLENLNALSGLVVSASSVTVTNKFTLIYTDTASPVGYLKDYSFGAGSRTHQFTQKVRTVGIPSYPPLPKIKNPISITHGLNAIALLVEAFRRTK